jgi:hypothetical protein
LLFIAFFSEKHNTLTLSSVLSCVPNDINSLSTLAKLFELFSGDNNYETLLFLNLPNVPFSYRYQFKMACANGHPAVPFFFLHLQDLRVIDDAIPTKIKVDFVVNVT